MDWDWARIAHDWDRHEWMSLHGEWASSQWDDARAERDEVRELLAVALREGADAAASARKIDWYDIDAAREALAAVERRLDGAVEPDESDYIAEGTIDPDGVSDDPGTCVWEDSWQGWDCTEGEGIYLAAEDGGIRIVHRWWRDAYGARHARDLWRVVEVTSTPEIAWILDEVELRVARDLWAELRPHLIDERSVVARCLSEDRRRELGLDLEDDEDPPRPHHERRDTP